MQLWWRNKTNLPFAAPQEDYQGEDGEGRRDGLQRSVLPMTGVRATLTLQQRTIKLDHFKISRKIPALFQSMKTVQNKFWFSILVWYIGTFNKKSRLQTVGGLFAPKIQAGRNPLEF